ncbi:MAG TPA: sortase [Nocardioides sp.]|uniref:DUF7507 domain-containing protein n=1 Tax=Nocardioides sp. TaxID=35761 RepID=UPI002C6102D9|nr:sortase [Nocardioides sp.]HTW13948.1 sortase [Nocardioides sp.]
MSTHTTARRRIATQTVLVLVGASLTVATLVGSTTAPAAAVTTDCTTSPTRCTATFSYTGAVENFVVPVGVTTIRAVVLGAQGGKSKGVDSGVDPSLGGLGGRTTADVPVTPGQTLRIVVGQQGSGGQAADKTTVGTFGGGGVPGQTTTPVSGSGGSGGGGSFVFGPGTGNLLIAAGGGGGAGSGTAGGVGGGATTAATAGANGTRNARGGGAATLTAVGAGGGAGTNGNAGAAGTGPATAPAALGRGGNGGAAEWSGAGGGGYRGGGGGGTDGGTTFPKYEGAGGGGRGYLIATGTLASSASGTRAGHGQVTLSWEQQATVTLVKRVNGRLVPDDQFTVTLTDSSGTTTGSVTTTGSQTTASTAALPVVRGRTYLITDRLTDASPSRPSDYTGTLACLTDSGFIASPPRPPIGVWELTIGTANSYVCTVENTADAANPELSLVKSVSPSGAADFTVGNTLTYSFVVTNTGNVAIDGVGVEELAFSGAGALPTPACGRTTLPPGEETTCTSAYTLLPADVSAGRITNVAEATGTAPGGGAVTSESDDAEVPDDPQPALALVKEASPQYALATGSEIDFTYTVTNSGNVAITDVGVVEETFSGSGTLGAAACAPTTLLPGEEATCTATYTTTQADMDAGDPVANVAHATGTAPGGGVVDSASDDAVVLIVGTPEVSLDKEVTPAVVQAAGDSVSYEYTVTNSGNVTVSAPSILEDSFSGSGTLPTPSCAPTTLAPSDTATCTAAYTVDLADIDSGAITNVAHARATDPDGSAVESTTDSAIVAVVPRHDLVLGKSAAPTSVGDAGDAVTYTYAVTNNGTATIANLAIDEVDFTGTGTLPDASCDETTLAPTDSTTCTSTYVVGVEDFGLATIDNTARAVGNGPGGSIVTSDESAASVAVLPPPATLVLDKSASPTTVDAAGEVVTYSFRVRNVGTGTATGLTIVERSFNGVGRPPVPTCPAGASVAPGAALTCTATYRVDAGDLGRSISNTAVVTATGPGGAAVVSAPDSATVSANRPAPDPPRLRTRTSDRRVEPGESFRVRVRVSRLDAGARTTAVARLYGPFTSMADAGCRAGTLARQVSWRVRNGASRSPAVRVPAPGVYVWRVSTRATASQASAGQRCGLRVNATTVARAAYSAPVVNGGYSGFLPQDPTGRWARTVVPFITAPGIGLRAPVVSTVVRGGRMVLPSSVATVARLGRSADFGERIGTVVVGGHVSDRHDNPGALWNLQRAERGQIVSVKVGKRLHRYRITDTASYPRTGRLPQRYFATTGRPRLVLISCTDRVVHPNGRFHYTRYQVVVARALR